MRKTRNAKLNLLSLENRLAPSATVAFNGGNLSVTTDHTPNTVYLYGNTGAMQVYINPSSFPAANTAPTPAIGGYRGTFNLTGNITVTGGNSNDTVFVSVANGGTISGNVSISGGNGHDVLSVQADSSGTVSGNITMNGGLGADDFSFINLDVQGYVNVNGGGNGLTVGSGGVQRPSDFFGIYDSNIAGIVLATSANVALDDFFGGTTHAPTTLQNSLVVNNTVAGPTAGGFFLVGVGAAGDQSQFPNTPAAPGATTPGHAGLLVIAPNATVQGNVTYTGGSGSDGVYNLGTVFGSLTAAMGAGDNIFSLGFTGTSLIGAANVEDGVVNGNVTAIASNGNDTLSMLNGSSVVAGAFNANLGDGTNSYNLANAANVVNGTFTLTAGNGTDNVGTLAGSLTGNVNVNLGNGANTINIQASISGTMTYQGGGGVDNVTVGGINGYALKVYLGAGDDVFTYSAGTTVGSAYLDFGAGNDTYNDNGNLVSWNQTQVNL